jgi:hypothetical protein
MPIIVIATRTAKITCLNARHQPESKSQIIFARRPERSAAEILVQRHPQTGRALGGVGILACYRKHRVFSHTAKVAKVLVRAAETLLYRKIPMTFGPARTPDMN